MNARDEMINRRKKERQAARKRREYLIKAQLVVESLIEGKVDENTLIKRLQHINQNHYDDIITERAIDKICGYPMCDIKLLNIPSKTHHIDSKRNKIYDITERKNFCSNGCYKASEYLKKQLSTEAVWLRNTDSISKFKFLKSKNLSDTDTIGVEVIAGNSGDLNDNEDYKINDINSESKDNASDVDNNDDDDDNDEHNVKNNFEPIIPKLTRDVKPPLNSSESVARVEDRFKQWFTVNTLSFLLGEDEIKSRIKKKATATDDEAEDIAFSDPTIREKYLKICEKLNLLDIEDETYDQQATSTSALSSSSIVDRESTTDYKKLQQDVQNMIVKTRSFYSGCFTVVTFEEDDDYWGEQLTDEENDRFDSMPLIDQRDQHLMRQKIVSDKLKNVLANLTRVTGVEFTDVTREILNLIQTFVLTAENIIFNVSEWNFVGFILLHLLSIKNQTLKQYLTHEATVYYQKNLLLAYSLNSTYLDNITDKLTDINFITQKYLDSLND